jgi:hypothetical protein
MKIIDRIRITIMGLLDSTMTIVSFRVIHGLFACKRCGTWTIGQVLLTEGGIWERREQTRR